MLDYNDASSAAIRDKNYKVVEQYLNTRGQDRLQRHNLFVEDGVSGLWTTETGKPIEIHGRKSMAEHAAWSLECFPDWKWYNYKIFSGHNPNEFWVECEGEGKINFKGYPEGHYHNNFLFAFEMDDGLIVRCREFMNPTMQMKALGIEVPKIMRAGIPQKEPN